MPFIKANKLLLKKFDKSIEISFLSSIDKELSDFFIFLDFKFEIASLNFAIISTVFCSSTTLPLTSFGLVTFLGLIVFKAILASASTIKS